MPIVPQEEVDSWSGWNVALKPAWEPVLLAMKPLTGTFAANALAWGVAGLNIGGGRIGTETVENGRGGRQARETQTYGRYEGEDKRRFTQGRWPANVILDEEAARALDEQSGESKSVASIRKKAGLSVGNGITLQRYQMNEDNEGGYNDTGGASRFFYCAKASKRERNIGLPDGLSNNHATVKPLALCQYLARLTKTPTGGVVLDPFCGSGSIGVASILEGRDFIGIDTDEDPKVPALEIAEYRLKWALEQVSAVSTPIQED